MTPIQEAEARLIRRAILHTLSLDTDFSMNIRLMQAALGEEGFNVALADVTAAARWLAAEALITLDEGVAPVLRLTQAGEDVAFLRARRDGVARQIPGA